MLCLIRVQVEESKSPYLQRHGSVRHCVPVQESPPDDFLKGLFS